MPVNPVTPAAPAKASNPTTVTAHASRCANLARVSTMMRKTRGRPRPVAAAPLVHMKRFGAPLCGRSVAQPIQPSLQDPDSPEGVTLITPARVMSRKAILDRDDVD